MYHEVMNCFYDPCTQAAIESVQAKISGKGL